MASRSSVRKWTPGIAPFAIRAAIASLSAGLPLRKFVITIETPGCSVDPTVNQRKCSRETSLRSSSPSVSR